MSEIQRISTSGKSMRVLAAAPSEDDLRRISAALGFELPASYIEFCQLGGLGELRFHNRVLAPREIQGRFTGRCEMDQPLLFTVVRQNFHPIAALARLPSSQA